MHIQFIILVSDIGDVPQRVGPDVIVLGNAEIVRLVITEARAGMTLGTTGFTFEEVETKPGAIGHGTRIESRPPSSSVSSGIPVSPCGPRHCWVLPIRLRRTSSRTRDPA